MDNQPSKILQGKTLVATVVTLTNLGISLWVLGELDESLHVLEETLTKYHQIHPSRRNVEPSSSDHLDLGKIYYNLSIVYFLRQDYNSSLL